MGITDFVGQRFTGCAHFVPADDPTAKVNRDAGSQLRESDAERLVDPPRRRAVTDKVQTYRK